MSFVRGSDNSFWSLFDASFLQELLVLATFAISFTLWRLQKQRYTPNLKSGYEAKAESHAAKVSKIPFTLEEEEQAKASEEKLLQMLATSNFTRALNLYRGYERCGLEVFFSEELFKSFIHAGIRVNKHDVVERMLRSMRRLNRRPSCQFWQQTMKLLSSRKHFTQCLVVYGIFEHQMPIDKVIFSCLINAALECKQLERIPDLLEKFSQASLVAKDHILHFRCYVQLGRAKDAQELFHRLSPEVSNLMLNLALLTSVNQQDPDGAYELLQSAKLIEQRNQGPNQEKLVDIVSYNTVMKGYGSAKYRSQCFECMKELIEHGLQPDEISLASLMDACIAENDEQLANEIGDLLLSKNLKPQMCTLFILSLVRAGAITKALALYDIMKRRQTASFRPSIAVYSVLIKALADQKLSIRAFELVHEMKAAGVPLDDLVLTHLLEACRHECNYQLGRQFFQEALDAGVNPSQVTLVTWLKLLGRCGAYDEAFQVVKNSESLYNCKPSVIHYTCLMSGCFRAKNYDQAWLAYELMKENGVQADETTMSTLIAGMVQGQQWSKVLALVGAASVAQLRPLRGVLMSMERNAPNDEVLELKALLKARS